MVLDITPKSFWSFPTSRLFQWDDDDDAFSNTTPSGLSVSEDDQSVYVEAALPGVNPDEVEITFDKGMLWIKGEVKEEEKKKKYYRKASSSFSYRVAVPGEVDLSKEPKADSKHGTLTVTFAKHPKSQPKKISVSTQK